MEILPEVAEAVAAGRPVVAMETSLVTHGMPLPQSLRWISASKQYTNY